MLHNLEAQNQWGNQFGFLHVSLPKLHGYDHSLNPLNFVYEAQKLIKRKRNSGAVYLAGKLLESVQKYRGPETYTVTVVSYMNHLRIALGTEKGVIDPLRLIKCIEEAYDMIFKATVDFI
ncbi:O-acyltransferase WSD1-like protein [Tanacetum coccineum]